MHLFQSLSRHRCCIGLLTLLLASVASAQSFQNLSVAVGFQPGFLANIPAGGLAVDDFDRNGYPDIFVTGYFLPNRMFFNQGNGQFTESTAVNATLPGTRCSVTAAADYDNDGWPDLYVGCRDQKNYLFRNTQQGQVFVDVTPPELDHTAAGANSPRTDSVAWADFNNDGLLDIFIAIYPTSTFPDLNDPDNLDRIVINNGDGTWTRVTDSFPQSEKPKLAKATLAAVISDLDGDLLPDIYVVNDKNHGNVFWHNDGPGCGSWCFSDQTAQSNLAQTPFGMGVAVGDVDRNGLWDLYFSSVDEQHFLRGDSRSPLHFTEEPLSPLNHYGVGWSTIFSDFDNDGWEDAYLACGSGSFSTTSDRDQVFRNLGGGVFQVVSTGSGMDENKPTQPAARIDFDRDGRTDLAVGHWNSGYEFYRNVTAGTGHWMAFTLTGGGAVNRDGIGTIVTVETADGAVQMREMRAGEARGSSHEKVLHFGLGNYTEAHVRVRWPDGTQQDLGIMAADQYHAHQHPSVALMFRNGFE
ncbi:MAG: CRTAC1 family protein [Lysobacterales bacterium]